jgi:hypothetical protein
MVRLAIPDCLVFLPCGSAALLVVDVSIMVVSCISSPHSQNPQYVLTIPGGSALAVVTMVRTTLSKEDKVDTSLAEVPMAQALVA